jgi:hypothetical protein
MSKPNTPSSAQEELRALLAEEFSEQETSALASSFAHTAERVHHQADAATRNMSVFVHEARTRAQRPRRSVFLGFAATALTAVVAVVIIMRDEPVPVLPAPLPSQTATVKAESTVDRVEQVPSAVSVQPRATSRTVSTMDVATIVADAEEEQIIETITQSVGETTTWTLQESDVDVILGAQNNGL